MLLAHQHQPKTDLLLGKFGSIMINIIFIKYQEREKFSPLIHLVDGWIVLGVLDSSDNTLRRIYIPEIETHKTDWFSLLTQNKYYEK